MASVPGLNATFDNLSTESINRWMRKTFKNAFTGNHPLWAMLMKNGNIVKGGIGYAWYEPFYYPTLVGPAVVGVSDGFQQIAEATETGGKTMASYVPAQFAMQVAVEDYDIKAQGTETQMVDHIQSTLEISRAKYFEKFSAQLWAAEATAGSGGSSRTQLCSLRTLFNGGGTANGPNAAVEPQPHTEQTIAAVGTTPITTVGGVNRTVAGGAYWCPNIYNPSTATTPSLYAFNKMYTRACRTGGKDGTDRPDLFLVPPILFDFFMTTLQNQQRWQGNGQLAEMGFDDSFKFRGADVMYDDGVPASTNANQAFAMNTKYLHLRYDTLEPVFELRPVADKLIRNWMSSQILQLTSEHLGGVHSRHCKFSDPS